MAVTATLKVVLREVPASRQSDGMMYLVLQNVPKGVPARVHLDETPLSVAGTQRMWRTASSAPRRSPPAGRGTGRVWGLDACRRPGLDPLLERFPRRKRGDGFGRNRDGLSCAGMPASPGGAVPELEAAKAPHVHGLPGLQGADNRLEALRQHGIGLRLGELDSGSHLVNEFSLGHRQLLYGRRGPRHGHDPQRAVLWDKRTQALGWCQVFSSLGVAECRSPARGAVGCPAQGCGGLLRARQAGLRFGVTSVF
jgi:hypothetical protein